MPDRPLAQIEQENADLNDAAGRYMAQCMAMADFNTDQEQNWILGHLVTFAEQRLDVLERERDDAVERAETAATGWAKEMEAYSELRARLAVLEAREGALRELEATWRDAEDFNLRCQITATKQGDDEVAMRLGHRLDVFKRCADDLAALLAPSSPADTETRRHDDAEPAGSRTLPRLPRR